MTATATGFVFAFGALFSWGINNALIRIPAQRIGVKQALFYRNLYTALFTCVAFVLLTKLTKPDWGQVALAVLLSGLGYISLLAMFRAKQVGKVGVISPVTNSSVAVTVLIAVFILGDDLSAKQGVAIAAIVVGIIVATIDVRQFRSSDLFRLDSGVPFAMITAVCWGVMFAFLSLPVAALGAVTTALILNVSNLVMSLVHLRSGGEKVLAAPKNLQWILVFMGLLSASAIICYNQALVYMDISTATAVAFSNPLVTMVFGMVLYKERHSPKAFVGLMLCIFGIAAAYYFR